MNEPQRLKRPIPTAEALVKRAALLRVMRGLSPAQLQSASPPGLSYGNSKTGRTGTKFRSVFIWNIPAVLTCPGASEACLQYCYNGDERKDIFPVELWNENLAWFKDKPNELLGQITSQLFRAPAPSAVRIHSSGDFFSPDYVDFWHKIAHSNPSVSFWAYTRSWCVPDLREKLEFLWELPNVELFASWDTSMSPPPPKWRLSIVTNDHRQQNNEELSGNKLFLCPEQIGLAPNCASCGFCMKREARGVLFTLH